MKRLAVLALFVLTAALHAQQITKILFTWNYEYSTLNNPIIPPCGGSPAVTSYCIQSYVLSEGTTTIATVQATSATSYSFTLTPLPSVGTHTYSLIAVELVTGASTVYSVPATVSLQVPQPQVPSTFKATPQ